MQGVHSHEARCLRGRQHRLIFIPYTLSCVLGPARSLRNGILLLLIPCLMVYYIIIPVSSVFTGFLVSLHDD